MLPDCHPLVLAAWVNHIGIVTISSLIEKVNFVFGGT